MTMEPDAEFGMLLEAPHAYHAQQKGFGQALAAGVPPDRAAAMCGLSHEEMAGALGVFKKARRLAHSVRRATKRVALMPHKLTLRGAKLLGRGLAAATGPIRRRIFRAFFGKLIARRARLLSWQRRRSLHPTAGDRSEARTWAVRYVKRSGLLGRLIGTALSGDVGAEPVTAALVTASVPVILELARRALKAAERRGAPSDPRAAEPQVAPPEEAPAEQ